MENLSVENRTFDNRRVFKRYRIRISGKVWIDGHWHSIETENLSLSGMRIVLDFPLLEGAVVGIDFTLPQKNGQPLHLKTRGVTVWCNEHMDAGFHAGIHFGKEISTIQDKLQTFMADYPEL